MTAPVGTAQKTGLRSALDSNPSRPCDFSFISEFYVGFHIAFLFNFPPN